MCDILTPLPQASLRKIFLREFKNMEQTKVINLLMYHVNLAFYLYV
jgi:hypothetical protein